MIGDGELVDEIKAIAGTNIKVLGRQSPAVILDHYRRCKALVFPGVEDLGIVPLEAMATGKPVIAFGRGGALETVIDGVTEVADGRGGNAQRSGLWGAGGWRACGTATWH